MVCYMFDVLLDFEQNDPLKGISKFSLAFCNRIENLVALRTDANVPMTLRYFLLRLCELLTLRPREFYEILKIQRERLLFTFSDSEITEIEDKYDALKRASTSGTSPFRVDRKLFEDSWKPYGDRYFKLRRFCGGMAMVLPGMSTVEGGFSLLGNEETPKENNISKLCWQVKALQTMESNALTLISVG